MKLPRIRYHRREQLELYPDDQPIDGRAGAAVAIGDFFEEAAAEFFKFHRLITDSTADLCPDLKGSNVYIENKASRRSHGVYLLYNTKLLAYRKWIKTFKGKYPPRLLYALWSYDVKMPSKIKWRDELRDALAQNIEQCVIVDYLTIRQMFKQKNAEQGSWSQYSEQGFRRIRLTQFRGMDCWKCWMMREGVKIQRPIFSKKLWKGRVYNREVGPVPVYLLIGS